MTQSYMYFALALLHGVNPWKRGGQHGVEPLVQHSPGVVHGGRRRAHQIMIATMKQKTPTAMRGIALQDTAGQYSDKNLGHSPLTRNYWHGQVDLQRRLASYLVLLRT